MHIGSLLLISGLLILLGNMVIAILFAVREQSATVMALVLGALMSVLIAVFNYVTSPGHYLAVGMGALAVAAALVFKKRPGWLAKLTISSTILVGLSQMIF